MPRRVIVAPRAALALDAAIRRFSQPGAGAAATRITGRLANAPDMLKAFPYAGKLSDDHAGYRQLVVAEYRFIYSLHPDTGDTATAGEVRIVAVLPPGDP